MPRNKVTIKLRADVDIDKKTGRPRLRFKNPAYYHQQVEQFRFDKKVLVTIENERSQRSDKQNRYWHGVCYPLIAETTGFTELEAKEWTIDELIPPKILKFKNKEYEVKKRTSELSKLEGIEYTTHMRKWAMDELNCHIPTPCEAGYFCERPELCENPDCPNKTN